MTKDELMKAAGIPGTWDCALPQEWVDKIAPLLWCADDIGKVVANFVWLYDDANKFGRPFNLSEAWAKLHENKLLVNELYNSGIHRDRKFTIMRTNGDLLIHFNNGFEVRLTATPTKLEIVVCDSDGHVTASINLSGWRGGATE